MRYVIFANAFRTDNALTRKERCLACLVSKKYEEGNMHKKSHPTRLEMEQPMYMKLHTVYYIIIQ